MAANDTLDLIFSNPSGADLKLDIRRVAACVERLQEIATKALGVQGVDAHLELVGADNNCIRLTFEIGHRRRKDADVDEATLIQRATLTIAKITLFLYIAQIGLDAIQTSAAVKEAWSTNELETASQGAQNLYSAEGRSLAEAFARSAAGAGAEQVVFRARGVEVVIVGARGVYTAKIAGRPVKPVPSNLGHGMASGGPGGGEVVLKGDPVSISWKGEVVTAVVGTVTAPRPHLPKPEEHRVLIIWSSEVPVPRRGRATVRFVVVDPTTVDSVGETRPELERLDGVINVVGAQDPTFR